MKLTVEQPQQEQIQPATASKPGWGTAAAVLVMLLILVVGGAAMVYSRIRSRTVSAKTLAAQTREDSVLSVSVVHPKLGAPEEEMVLPGNTQAFTDSPIYARTSGYLKKWYVDIGTRVKAGELLAEIDTPELDQQLQQARADLATAQANVKLAQTTADRWVFLLKTDSVSRQETDEKTGDLKAKKAMVDASENAVHRLEDLQSYEKVTAPFDGVITARNTDVGALIDGGATLRRANCSTSPPLMNCASSSTCRRISIAPRNPERTLLCNSRSIRAGLSPGRWCATPTPSTPRRARCWWRWTSTTPPASCCPARTSRCT